MLAVPTLRQQKPSWVASVKVDFSRDDGLSYLNELFTSTGTRLILGDKDYCRLGILFTFVISFINRKAGLVEHTPVSRLETWYFVQLHFLMDKNGVGSSNEAGWNRRDGVESELCYIKYTYQLHIVILVSTPLLFHQVDDKKCAYRRRSKVRNGRNSSCYALYEETRSNKHGI